MTDEFIIERDDRLLIVTINRPHRLNALHFPAHEILENIFDEFEADDNSWVAIITGAGPRAFCAGSDLKYQAEGHPWPPMPKGFGGLTSRFDAMKPIICAINGLAMGGGFEIALACDMIVADESAMFGFPEPKVGTAALGGGLHRLPRQIPLKRALEVILTGRSITAHEGFRLGFVNEVVPAGQSLVAAKKWASMIIKNSQMSVRASKQAIYNGLNYSSLGDAIDASYPAVDALLRSHDYVEGPKAFTEKREPLWQLEQ